MINMDTAAIVAHSFKGFIITKIESLTVQEFYDLVQQGEFPDILDYDLPPWLEQMGFIKIVKDNMEKILSGINMSYALKLTRDNRPDLLPVLETEEGAEWMELLLELIKFRIKNMELDKVSLIRKYKSLTESVDVPITHVRDSLIVPEPPLPMMNDFSLPEPKENILSSDKLPINQVPAENNPLIKKPHGGVFFDL